MSTINTDFRLNDVLTTVDTTIVISITRCDTEQEFVTNEAMTELTPGKYEYTFTDPDTDLKYEFTVDIIHDSNSTKQVGNKYGTVTKVYANRDEAQVHMDNHLYPEPWECAKEPDQVKSGLEATRRIDRLALAGVKNSEAQLLQFPRGDNLTVPNAIKEAQFEIQLALLDEVEEDDRKVTSRSFGGIRTTYDSDILEPWIAAGILSKTAWALLQPYLRSGRQIKLHRES